MLTIRRCRTIVVLLIVIGSDSSASAATIESGEGFLSLGSGLSLPMGEFGDLALPGYLAGAGFEIFLSTKVSAGIEATYHSYGITPVFKTLYLGGVPPGIRIRWNFVQLSAYGKFLMFSGGTSPYIKHSVGSYRLRLSASGFGTSASISGDSDIGLSYGLGLQFPGGGRLGGFAEAMYHHVFAGDGGFWFVNLRGGLFIQLGGE